MKKVRFRYALKDETTGWFTRYKTQTEKMELPKNEYGVVLMTQLGKQIAECIKMQHGESFRLIWYQVIRIEEQLK